MGYYRDHSWIPVNNKRENNFLYPHQLEGAEGVKKEKERDQKKKKKGDFGTLYLLVWCKWIRNCLQVRRSFFSFLFFFDMGVR